MDCWEITEYSSKAGEFFFSHALLICTVTHNLPWSKTFWSPCFSNKDDSQADTDQINYILSAEPVLFCAQQSCICCSFINSVLPFGLCLQFTPIGAQWKNRWGWMSQAVQVWSAVMCSKCSSSNRTSLCKQHQSSVAEDLDSGVVEAELRMSVWEEHC